ncbi:probable RNA-directed DNA polymerase from transposon X-element [Aspergillus udagawae]|nr:probable RNA-directed DNA polymerase from transposon X-element [Aspergillus udagawae]
MTIQPTESARYLGIWLDKTLSFNTHRTKIINRANSSLEALRSITGSTWGASLMAMRKIYRAVVVPQLLYGVTAWFNPRQILAVDQNKIINEVSKIQKRAAVLISGAFQGTAAAALNMELHLLPVRLQIQQVIEETAIRIQTGPRFACPRGLTEKPRPTIETRRNGLTPLEALRKRGGSLAPTTPRRVEIWESRKTYVLPPWEPPLQRIIEDYDAALKTHDEICKDGNQLVIYTDGGGYQGQVGASAVCLRKQWTRQNHLGTEMDSTVYAAELDGIRMAMDIARDVSPRSVTLFADGQAAIQAVQNPRRPSGQYILDTIYRKVRALGASGLTDIQIRWIPAHVGVAGNEAADEAAKEAAARGEAEVELSSAEPEQPLIRLAAAAKRAVRQRIQQRWKKQWETEKGAKPTRRLIKAPHKKNLGLYKGLSKPHTSIIIQMRTMRIGLRHFLYKIKASETDRCSCGEGSQTPRHVLLQCSLHAEARRQMISKLHDVEGLRGKLSDYDALVSDPQAIRYIAEFMHQTGLLSQFRHAELTEPAEQDQEQGSLLRGSGIDVEDDG